MEDLGAETAAHIGGHHAQFMLGDAQHEGAHQQADHMGVLAGREQRMVTRTTGIVAHGHARLHRVGDEAVVHQLQRGDMVRILECLIHRRFVLLHKAPVVAQVAGQFVMYFRRAVLDRVFHVDHRRQFGDIDHNRLGCVARLLQRVGNHGGNRLAHMADLAVGQHRMARLLHDFTVFVCHLPAAGDRAYGLEIRARKHAHHAFHAFRGRSIHAVERAMCNIRTQEIDVSLPVDVDVICIVAFTGQKPDVLAPLAAGADTMIFWH